MADFFWDRIEPHTRDPELEEGLQARLADPLWLLSRQWQLGEFRGEDAASPIHVRATVEHFPLASFRNGAVPGAPAEPFPEGRPLESRVEAEARAGDGRLADAADSGLQPAAPARRARTRSSARKAALRVPARDPTARAGGAAGARPASPAPARAELARRPTRTRRRPRTRACGCRPGGSATARAVPSTPGGPSSSRPSTGPARPARPGWRTGSNTASVSSETPQRELTFGSSEYPGGRLDWHAFDVTAVKAKPKPPGPLKEPGTVVDLLPVPLAYAGMPASSHWEMEEGSVYFGGVEAGPADLGRLAVAEFATVYSDDWFLVPLRFPSGSIRTRPRARGPQHLRRDRRRPFGRRVGPRAARRRPAVGLLRAERRPVGRERRDAVADARAGAAGAAERAAARVGDLRARRGGEPRLGDRGAIETATGARSAAA